MQPGNLLGNLLEFGGHLRRGGLDVHTGRVLDVIESLPHIDLSRRDDVYNTLRTLLVHRHDDFAVFDSVFTQFFGAAREQKAPREQASRPSSAWAGLETAGVSGEVDLVRLLRRELEHLAR